MTQCMGTRCGAVGIFAAPVVYCACTGCSKTNRPYGNIDRESSCPLFRRIACVVCSRRVGGLVLACRQAKAGSRMEDN